MSTSMYLIKNHILHVILFVLHTTSSESLHIVKNVHMTKAFILQIDPKMFNWTFHGESDHFVYRPSLINAPDLPSWIHFLHSKDNHSVFLYGTPPLNQEDVKLEVVCLNHRTYETRKKEVSINVLEMKDPAKYEIQMKIDNFNVEDMFDHGRRNRLLDVFRKRLWPASENDLYVTFLESAVHLGARLPLKPNDEEGIVMKVGSQFEFSPALIELQNEVKPLWKKIACPRDYKRTTVERHFREIGFILDWCAFRLLESTPSHQPSASHDNDLLNERRFPVEGERFDRWVRPSKSELPQRSYVNEFVVTILVPMMIMIFLVFLLSVILCFHHEGIFNDGSSDFFDTVFDTLEEAVGHKRVEETPAVQMVQYTAVHRATNTLRSLSSQRQPSELYSSTITRSRTSTPSSSPRLSMEQNSFYRPNPPPYSGPAVNSGHEDDF